MTIWNNKLNETKAVNESLRLNCRDKEILDLIESARYPKLTNSDKITMKMLLENAKSESITSMLNESTVSQDIARFTPLLMPIIRNLYPRLVANHLIGVQPINQPTAYIYALISQYRAKAKDERVNLVLYKLDKPVTEKKDDDIDGETVIYTEDNYVIVTNKAGSKNQDRVEYKKVGETFGTYTIQAVYSNVTSFPKVLSNYSKMAKDFDEQRPDFNNVGFTVTRKPVEARERSLRAEYSIEMYTDLKNQHGLLADDELLTLMTNQIQTEVDAEVVNFVNKTATQYPDFDLANFTGRTTVEKARELAFKIAYVSSDIARRTRRGIGNVILCSAKIANLLASLDGYYGGPVKSDLMKVGNGTGFVGVLSGQYKVVVDPYAEDDYVTVLYKGEDRYDALGYFCPYIPLNFQRLNNSQTGAFAIIARMRYALVASPGFAHPDDNDRAALYASTFNVTGIDTF